MSLVTFARYFPSRVLMTLVSLSVMHAGGHSHGLEFCGTVFLWERLALSAFTPAAASSLFFDLALCLGGQRARLDSDMCARIRPVYMSGGAFSLSFSLVLSARLAPFHRLPFTTVHRESLSASSSLEALCTWLYTCGLTFGLSALRLCPSCL